MVRLRPAWMTSSPMIAAPRLYMYPFRANRSLPVPNGQPSVGSSGYKAMASLTVALSRPLPIPARRAWTSASVLRLFRGPKNVAVPSSVFEPASTATLATSPAENDLDGSLVRNSPSRIGVMTNGSNAAKSSEYGTLRRQTRVSLALPHPTVSVTLS